MVSLSSPRSEAGSPHSIRHRQVTSYSDIGDKRGIFLPVLFSLPCLRRQMFCQLQEYCYKHFKPSVKILEVTEKLYPGFSNQAGLHTFYSLFTEIICVSLFPPSFYYSNDSNAFSRYALTNLNHTLQHGGPSTNMY